VPGPGPDEVTTLFNDARSRIWTDVVFTTGNVVAPPMDVPASAVGTLTPNKPSPLAVSVRNVGDVQVGVEWVRWRSLHVDMAEWGIAEVQRRCCGV
jgi:hypothetical protein